MIASIALLMGLAGMAASARGETRTTPAVRAVGPVLVDGNLDEAVWQTAPVAGSFYQRNPVEGAVPECMTEFRVLYDDEAVYIGVWAYDKEPHKIRGLLTRRDEESPSDWIEVGIDSYHDRRTAYVFGINPANVQKDFLIYDDLRVDYGWDAVWSAAAQTSSLGWTSEFRIPLSQLRFSAAEKHTWGLQVLRTVARANEETTWSPWPKSKPQIVSNFGTVTGIERLAPSRRIELIGQIVGGVSVAEVAPGDPFRGTVEPTVSPGFDFRYGLGSNLTLSVTINPDFSHVEADPSEVNLSANEIFVAEKRPFFLEGSEIFQFGLAGDDGNIEQLFYSRRIGAPPHQTVDVLGDFAYASAPPVTTIYGAAKVAGKTADGWSIGALNAITGQETAEVVDADGNRQTHVVEPLTNYAVLRLGRDFREGRSSVSGALTAVHRKLGGTGLDGLLHDQAYTGGLKFHHRFAADRLALEARLVGSYVHGDKDAIARTQRAPQRYYQRPDAEHLNYDPELTSLRGEGLIWLLTYYGKRHWNASLVGDIRSPGLEVNDLGFQQGADGVVPTVWVQYREDEPGPVLRNYRINGYGSLVTDWAPDVLGMGGNVNGSVSFLNYWAANGGVVWNEYLWDVGALRGGPALRSDRTFRGWLGMSTDARDPVYATVSGTWVGQPASDSQRLSLSSELVFRARSNLHLSVGPLVERNTIDNQYVAEAADTGGTPHYIMGRLLQTTLAFTLRMNYTVSPGLTLQLYMQPYISTGVFSDYKAVEQPRAPAYADRYHIFDAVELTAMDGELLVDRDLDGVTDYSFAPADFNFRQLHSNLILRWEYRPGSTVFLVWSHARSSTAASGVLDLGDELGALASEQGEHTVLVKVNYWYSL